MPPTSGENVMPEWGQEQKGAILSRWFTRSRSERLCINSNFRTRKLGVSSANLCVLSQICGPDWICEIWNFQCGFSGTSGQGMGEFVKRKHRDIFFSSQDSNWYGIAVWRFTHICGSSHPYDRDVYDTFVRGIGILGTYVSEIGHLRRLPLGLQGTGDKARKRKDKNPPSRNISAQGL